MSAVDDYFSVLFDKSDDSMDDILDVFESSYAGYTSYRTWFNDEYNWLDGSFTNTELDYIYSQEIIFSETRKTFFNKDALIIIQGKAYKKLEEDITISCDANDLGGIQILETIDKEYDIHSITELFYAQADIERFDFHSSTSELASKGGIILTAGLEYETEILPESVNCEPLNKTLKIWAEQIGSAGLNTNPDTHFQNVVISIDWGDETIETIEDYVWGEEIPHTYPNVEEDYSPTVLTSFEHPTNNFPLQTIEIWDGDSDEDNTWSTDPQTINFIVDPTVLCTNEASSIHPSEISGSKQLRSKTWVDAQWLTDAAQVGAYTHGWRMDGGSWERERGRLRVEIEGTFFDNSCQFVDTKSGTKEHGHDKKVQKTKTKGSNHYHVNDDINSFHTLDENGVFIDFTNWLNLCN